MDLINKMCRIVQLVLSASDSAAALKPPSQRAFLQPSPSAISLSASVTSVQISSDLENMIFI